MKPWAIALTLAALTGAAAAQNVSGQLSLSRDSDDLRETLATTAYRSAQGWGLKAGALHYSALGWSEDGALLAATYRQDDATLRLDASLGAAQLAGHEHLVASLDATWPIASSSSLGLSLERDYINSVAGIDQGITFDNLALVADHSFGAGFNVGLAGGVTRFSNDNRRPFLRIRWNFELEPSYGLNAYLKTRSYQNSAPNQPQYFSPARLNEVSAGLSSRFVVAERLVLSAAADAGSQHTETGAQRIWSCALRLGALRTAALQWSVGLDASNAAGTSQASTSGSYRYTRAVAQLSLPI